MGNAMGNPTSFCIACAVNPCAANLDLEIEKFERKVEAGVHVAFTQPLFEMNTLENFLKRIGHLSVPVMLGILPLRGYKHADFLHNEIPGMRIPERIRTIMRDAGKDAPKQGVKIAREFLKEAKSAVAGVYIMPPFRKYDVIDDLLEVLS